MSEYLKYKDKLINDIAKLPFKDIKITDDEFGFGTMLVSLDSYSEIRVNKFHYRGQDIHQVIFPKKFFNYAVKHKEDWDCPPLVVYNLEGGDSLFLDKRGTFKRLHYFGESMLYKYYNYLEEVLECH